MIAKFRFLLLFILLASSAFAQVPDTSTDWKPADSLLAMPTVYTGNSVNSYLQADSQAFWKTTNNHPVVNDIQQFHSSEKSGYVFILLVTLLAALTYLKTAFGKDLDELVQSVVNQNLAQQIFRTQSKEISFSTVVLNLNFIVVMSLYVQFIFVRYFHVSMSGNLSSILFMIFLFTFFYLGKLAVVKVIGVLFEVSDASDEYIFNFTTICKTLGLALLPALFIFYTAPQKFFNYVFVITVLIFVVMVLTLLWRGLSTAYKLLYRGVYHFFIYVCVVEISTIFLLFKLLTKTIN